MEGRPSIFYVSHGTTHAFDFVLFSVSPWDKLNKAERNKIRRVSVPV